MIIIYKDKQANRLRVISQTAYLFSFNAMILIGNQIAEIEYVFMLMPSFLSESQIGSYPMIQYGQVVNFNNYAQQNIAIGILQPRLDIHEIGYLPVQKIKKKEVASQFLYFQYKNQKNVKKYGNKFWQYKLYVKTIDNVQQQLNKSILTQKEGKIGSQTYKLVLSEDKLTKVTNFCCQKQLQFKSERDLLKKLNLFFIRIHQIIVKIISCQDKKTQQYKKLIQQRERIYFDAYSFQQQYLKQIKAGDNYQNQKMEELKGLSNRYSKNYQICFPQKKLHLNRNNVYEQYKDKDILSVIKKLPELQNLYKYLCSLSNKQIWVQFYLLREFYFKFNSHFSQLQLQKLIDLQAYERQRQQRLQQATNNTFELELTNKNILTLESKKYQLFKLNSVNYFNIHYHDELFNYLIKINTYHLNQHEILTKYNQLTIKDIFAAFQNQKNKKTKVFATKGFAFLTINNKQIAIQFQRFRRPIKQSYKQLQMIQIQQKTDNNTNIQNIPENWKTFNRVLPKQNGEKLKQIQFSECQILLIYHDKIKQKYSQKKIKANFISFSAILTEYLIKDNENLVDSWAVFSLDEMKKYYHRIVKWAYPQTQQNYKGLFCIGLLQNYEEIKYLKKGYLGFSQSNIKQQKYVVVEQFGNRFYQKIKLYQTIQKPYFEIQSQKLSLIRSCLSKLSFDIFSQKVVNQQNSQDCQKIINHRKKITEYQKQYQSQPKFNQFMNNLENNEFYLKRREMIKQYQDMMKLYQKMNALIQEYKCYDESSDCSKFQHQILKHLQITDQNKLIFNNQKNLNQRYIAKQQVVNQDLAIDLQNVKNYIQTLNKKRAYLQVQLLKTQLQKMVNCQQEDEIIESLFLVAKVPFQLQQNESDIINVSSKYQLPKLKFRQCLTLTMKNQIDIPDINKSNDHFYQIMNKLYQTEWAGRYRNQMFNKPMSKRQKQFCYNSILSWQKLNQKITPIMNDPNSIKLDDRYLINFNYYYEVLKQVFPQKQILIIQIKKKMANQLELSQNQLKIECTYNQILTNPSQNYNQTNIMENQIQKVFEDENIAQKHILQQRKINRNIYYQRLKVQKNRVKYLLKSVQNKKSKDLQAKWYNRKKRMMISFEDFDPQFNYQYSKIKPNNLKQIQWRGGLPFYQGSQCIKLAINIRNKYRNDKYKNHWIGMRNGPNEFALAYHGVKQPLLKCQNNRTVLQNIMQDNLIVGNRNACSDFQCIVHSDRHKIGKGVYLTPHIKTALQYCKQKIEVNKNVDNNQQLQNSQIQKAQYALIFMVRIHPQNLHICSFQIQDQQYSQDFVRNDYWIVNQPKFIRPYAILLIKKQITDKYPQPEQQFGQRFLYINYKEKYQDWLRKKKQFQRKQQERNQTKIDAQSNSRIRPINIENKRRIVKDKQCQIY